jgi:hypothetical protein
MKWAADDDVLEPEFVARCVEQSTDPDLVLATRRRASSTSRDRGGRLHVRAGHGAPRGRAIGSGTLAEDRWCFELFGVIRAETLRRTRLLDRYVGSDRVLPADLAREVASASCPSTCF